MSKPLKPCPFCGGTRLAEVSWEWVECSDCGAIGPSDGQTEGRALWNHRADETEEET